MEKLPENWCIKGDWDRREEIKEFMESHFINSMNYDFCTDSNSYCIKDGDCDGSITSEHILVSFNDLVRLLPNNKVEQYSIF